MMILPVHDPKNFGITRDDYYTWYEEAINEEESFGRVSPFISHN